jgi:hypothetical protein
MTRVTEAITPPQAGSSISDPGIEGGAPAAAAPIPAATEAEGAMGPPTSQGAGNILTGGMVELDPGPPSSQASGEGEWGGGGRGLVTPIPGPIGGDASLRSELEECYHMPSGSTAQEGLPVGREGQDGMFPPAHPAGLEKPLDPREVGKVHGGDQTPMPTTPAPASPGMPAQGSAPATNLTAGPKSDAYIVHGQTDGERDRGRRAFIYRGFGAKL